MRYAVALPVSSSTTLKRRSHLHRRCNLSHSQSFAQVVRGIKMEVLDAKGLSERLRWEDNEYWLHLEAETPFEKYPG